MTPLHFWKMAGAGNDFVVVDGRAPLPAAPRDLARALCPRQTAVGADGLVVVRPAGAQRVAVDFFNADGSPAGFCGNASRCIARFAVMRGMTAAPLTIAFPALEVRAELTGPQRARVTTPRPSVVEEAIVLDAAGTGRRIRAGVDHVVFADAGTPLPPLVEALFAARPDLRGEVNVTLVRRIAPSALAVRTFERGAGETLACGSGALAAVLWSGLRAASVVPPAGVALDVTIGEDEATLEGEARLVYEGDVKELAGDA